MSISHIPKGFQSVTPYFTISGAENFLTFLQEAFDAEIVDRHDRENGDLWHAAIKIYDSMIEASEATSEYTSKPLSIHLYVPDTDAMYARAIAAGGKSLYEPADMPYGERSGGVEDPCGNSWYIATQISEMYP
jgi:PhnB protein